MHGKKRIRRKRNRRKKAKQRAAGRGRRGKRKWVSKTKNTGRADWKFKGGTEQETGGEGKERESQRRGEIESYLHVS